MGVTGKLVKHGAIYVVARVATMGAPYVLLPLFAHRLGREGLGTIELLATASTFLSAILLQGLGGAWVRLRFDYTAREELAAFDATLTYYLLLSNTLALALLALIGPWLAPWLTPGIPFFPLGMMTVLFSATTAFHTLGERKLQAEQRPLAYAVFSLLRVCLSVGLVVAFIVGLDRGVQGKLEADIVWGAALALAAIVMIRPGSPRKVAPEILRSSLVYGLPLVPHTLSALIGGMTSRLLLNGMVGVAAVGVYSMGFRLAWAANVIATALNQAYSPLYVLALKDAEKADADRARQIHADLGRTSLVSVVLVSCAALAITAWGRELIAVIATPEFEESWKVLALINASSIAYAFYLPFSQSVLQTHEGTRVLPIATVSSGVTSVVATLVLVPPFGIVGAAVAALAGSVVLALAAYWFGQHRVRLPLERGRWWTVLVTAIGALATFAALDATPMAWLPRFALKTGVLVAAVALLLAAAGGLAMVKRFTARRPPRPSSSPVESE